MDTGPCPESLLVALCESISETVTVKKGRAKHALFWVVSRVREKARIYSSFNAICTLDDDPVLVGM